MDPLAKTFPAQEAELIGRRALELGESAQALSVFAEESPELAQMAGVEVSALEARSILRSGVIPRVAAVALGNARTGRPAVIGGPDLETISRLEAIVTLSGARIAASVNSLDQQKSRSGMESFGSMIGMATGVVGLWKALF